MNKVFKKFSSRIFYLYIKIIQSIFDPSSVTIHAEFKKKIVPRREQNRRNLNTPRFTAFHSAYYTPFWPIHLKSKEGGGYLFRPINIFRQDPPSSPPCPVSRVWTASIPRRLVRAKAPEAALISRRLCPGLFHPRHEIYNAVRRAFAFTPPRPEVKQRRGRGHRGAQAP